MTAPDSSAPRTAASAPRTAASAPRFAALRSPAYRPYFAWTLLSMTADSIEHVISYWVIYQAFHSPALAGFAVISHWMPFLLLSVWAGALADRRDCRALIQVSQALYMLASAAWGLLFLTGALATWHAVVILLVHGAAGVVQAPSSQLIVHDMVEPADLASAIRLLASARYLAILLGPAIGGGMMLLLGPAWGLLANVLVYIPLTVFLTRVPFTGHLHRRGAPSPAARLGLGDAASLVDAVRADRRILTMILLGGATSFFVGNAFQAQMPEYAADLGMDDAGAWYTVLLAANAAGAVLGALLLESTNALRPSARTAILCAGAWAVTIGAFPWARTYALAVTLLVLAGVFNIAFTSMAQTLVQILAPASLRGTVVGWFNTAMLGLRAGSGITVGVLGALIDIHWSLALSALAVVVTAVMLLAVDVRAGTPPAIAGGRSP